MRNAQNVMKFGLKLGAFAALATALSGCLVVIDPGPPSIGNLVTNSTYNDGNGVQRDTRLDFSVDVVNATVKSFDAIVTSIPEGGDVNVTDPTKVPEGISTSPNIAFVETSRINGVGTLSSFVNLTMSDKNQFLSLKAIVVAPCNIRLWVRATFVNGDNTSWLKSAQIKPIRPC